MKAIPVETLALAFLAAFAILTSCSSGNPVREGSMTKPVAPDAPQTAAPSPATPTTPAVAPAPNPRFWLTPAPGVFVSVSTFEMNNMTLVCSGKEAMLIDTGYNKAEGLRVKNYLEANGISLLKIINTHEHPDHVGNNKLFNLSADAVHTPANTPDGTEFKLGDRTLRIVHTPGHHQEGDMGVLIVEEGIFAAGDILFTCLPPQLSYGSTEAQVTPTLRKLQAMHFKTVIPGHGRLLGGDELLAMSLDYIEKLKVRVQSLVDSGDDPDKKPIELKDCIQHADWMLGGVAEDLHYNNAIALWNQMRT